MDVVGVISRRIEVHDARKVVDMDPPGHHIGGDQGVGLALGEGIERTLTLALGPIAVHRDRPNTLRLKLADDPVGPSLRAAEHEGLAVLRHELGRDGDALGPIHFPEVMGDVALLFFGRFDVDPNRVVLIAADDRLDLTADRGREEDDLALGRGLVQEAANGGEEAHVGHAVRLVEHDGGDVVEHDVAALDEVLEASRDRRRRR